MSLFQKMWIKSVQLAEQRWTVLLHLCIFYSLYYICLSFANLQCQDFFSSFILPINVLLCLCSYVCTLAFVQIMPISNLISCAVYLSLIAFRVTPSTKNIVSLSWVFVALFLCTYAPVFV